MLRLAIDTGREAEMTFQSWNEIGMVQTLAIAIALESRGVNLGLRDLIVPVAILRMLSKPLLNVSRHRGLLLRWLSRLRRRLLNGLAI